MDPQAPEVSGREHAIHAYASWLAVVTLAASACGGGFAEPGATAPHTTPTAVSSAAGFGPADRSAHTQARGVTTYTLANGTFTLMTNHARLTGTYTGVVAAPTSGRPTVTMTLTVTGGTKAFAGASGTLQGDGKGAFLTEGSFVLSLEGVVRTSAVPAGAAVHTTVVGKATLADECSNFHIISRLRGEGTIPTEGRARAEFESEIVETGCFED